MEWLTKEKDTLESPEVAQTCFFLWIMHCMCYPTPLTGMRRFCSSTTDLLATCNWQKPRKPSTLVISLTRLTSNLISSEYTLVKLHIVGGRRITWVGRSGGLTMVTGKTRSTRKKPVPVPLFPPQAESYPPDHSPKANHTHCHTILKPQGKSCLRSDKQDRQCMHNATLMRVHKTIVAVEKQ